MHESIHYIPLRDCSYKKQSFSKKKKNNKIIKIKKLTFWHCWISSSKLRLFLFFDTSMGLSSKCWLRRFNLTRIESLRLLRRRDRGDLRFVVILRRKTTSGILSESDSNPDLSDDELLSQLEWNLLVLVSSKGMSSCLVSELLSRGVLVFSKAFDALGV